MRILKNTRKIFLLIVINSISITSLFAQLPNEILIKSPGLYPEGITYDIKSESFFVSSVLQGKILKVDKNGKSSVFSESEKLVSTLGMAIDKKRNRLIVCNTDPGMGMKSSESTMGKLAEIIIYNLKTGEKIKNIDLGKLIKGPHLLNDITLDKKGNIYASDSFTPAIYKIDTKGNASILIQNGKFAPASKSFGLNGLIFHPDGYLIVGKYDQGILYKIPVKKPENFNEIKINNKTYPTIDGIKLLDDNTIALVSNNMMPGDVVPAVYKLTTNSNWKSAEIVEAYKTGKNTFPTTLTKVDGSLYVIHSNLHMLMSGNKPMAETFKIEKIIF